MTKHEVAARAYFASLTGKDPELWVVIGSPEPGIAYDFASPEDEQFGQCWTDKDGRWKQAPMGKQPVVLALKSKMKKAPKKKPAAEASEKLSPVRRTARLLQMLLTRGHTLEELRAELEISASQLRQDLADVRAEGWVIEEDQTLQEQPGSAAMCRGPKVVWIKGAPARGVRRRPSR